MMTIEIVTQSILEDMRIKSHLEAQRIQVPEERDAARIDDEDMDEVNRDVSSASASLARVLQRFLAPDSEYLAGGALSLETTIEYNLNFSDRRAAGKEQQLEDAFHSYLVNFALAAFFRAVSQPSLSQVHEVKAREDENNIIAIINHKSAPTWQD